MAWTNLNFYMTLGFLTVIVFVTLGLAGNSLLNNDRISLDEKSEDYVGELQGINEDSGYDTVSEREAVETSQRDPLENDDNRSVSDEGDFLSSLFIKKERSSVIIEFLSIVYNVPTTVLKSLGLPLSGFNHIVNITVYLSFLGILIIIWRDFIRT